MDDRDHWCGGAGRIHLAEDRDRWRAAVNKVINYRVLKPWNFLITLSVHSKLQRRRQFSEQPPITFASVYVFKILIG
jgi:hypothetical protein